MRFLLRLQLAFATFLAVALAAPAQAVPVDLSDPTLRNITIELESTPCVPFVSSLADCRTFANDPGATFGTVLTGTFEIVGGEAIVTIAGPDWEQVLFTQQGVGSTAPDTNGILPGTTSDAVLRFDVVTGAPTAWDWTADLRFNVIGFWMTIPLVGSIAASPNDVYFTNFFGTDLALNCNAAGGPAPVVGDCVNPVTHQAYDPLTGTITAMGAVANGIVRPAWAPADWMLSEVPEPEALVMLSMGIAGLAALGCGAPRRR